MAMEKIKNVLIELGLSETETRVYLSMIELGPSSVQNIAKVAQISRTAAYEIIGSLQHKGIASTFQKGKKKLFAAEDPGKLKDYFKNKMENMKSQLGELHRMIPEMRIMQAEDRPVVRFYTGNDGIRALFRDVEETHATELLEFTNSDVIYSEMDVKLILELRKSTFFSKLPVRSIAKGEIRNVKPRSSLRHIDGKFGEFTGNIWIYKNRVGYVNVSGNPETIIIESQVFADSMRAMFKAAWLGAK